MMLRWFVLLHVVGVVCSQNTLPEHCLQEVEHCEELESQFCLGVELSSAYSHTAVVFVNGSANQRQARDQLEGWTWLRHVPRCWEVVQPFLCSVYLPSCSRLADNRSAVVKPRREMCELTREPCRVVDKAIGWPSFLKCDQPHFISGCQIVPSLQPERVNTTSTCYPPLIPTTNEKSWYSDIEGCGVQCENPLFTPEQHAQTRALVAVLGTTCLLCTLFTIMTFIIDWKQSRRYPGLILFFINVCFFIGSLGWMMQFLPGMREEIVCKRDGTRRQNEPQNGSEESSWCGVVFFIVYFTMIATLAWFMFLAYAWNITFRAFGHSRETLEPQKAFFHLAAWSVSLVLTTVCLAIGKVDGDSLSGICFVGYNEHLFRVIFVLVPVGLVCVVGFGFIGAGLVTLVRVQCTQPGVVSEKASAKIRDTIIRLGIFAGLALLFFFTTFAVHVYTFVNEDTWQDSFEQYMLCQLRAESERLLFHSFTDGCEIRHRPNLVAHQIHIFVYFGSGIAMSSWLWNMTTVRAWQRAFRRWTKKKSEEPLKVKKHEIIARAFEKRSQMNAGRLSLSFASTRGDDPIGLHFDINSISSQEMTSVWTAALPRMMVRRGGMVYPSMPRRHSDSDLESMKSLSSLKSRILAMQTEILRRQANPQYNSQESQSQQESLDSDRSRRKKRRHRKKRPRNRVVPFSTPSPSGPSAQGTSSQADDARKGSLTSLGTNQTLTNVSNQPQSSNNTSRVPSSNNTSRVPSSNNTSRVPSSDEGRATPEPNRPECTRTEAKLVGNARLEPKEESKRMEIKRSEFPKRSPLSKRANLLPIGKSKAIREISSTKKPEKVMGAPVHSSDEEMMTPKLKRPTFPHSEEEEDEVFNSSDEDCVTPELQRPSTSCTKAFEAVSSSSDSINSSDSQCATPEFRRPEYARFTTITKETKTTIHTGIVRTSLLDQVELDDLDFDSEDSEQSDSDLDLTEHVSASQVFKSRSFEKSRSKSFENDQKKSKRKRFDVEHSSSERDLTPDGNNSNVLDKRDTKSHHKSPKRLKGAANESVDKSDEKGQGRQKGSTTKEKRDDKLHGFLKALDTIEYKDEKCEKPKHRKRRDSGYVFPESSPHIKQQKDTLFKKQKDKSRKDKSEECPSKKVKGHRRKEKIELHADTTKDPELWHNLPFECDSDGRSRSPQMTSFQKVKDWIFAPALTPEPMPPIELPELENGQVQGHTRSSRKSRSRAKKGKVNIGYEESEA